MRMGTQLTLPRFKRKRRKSSESVSLMKKKAWREFSEFVRRRDSVNGFAVCVTCQCSKPWKEMHAGHFIQGRGNSILFDERGVHVQCYCCNVKKHGNLLEYYYFMENKFGKKTIEELRALNRISKQMKLSNYKEIYDKYKQLNKKEGL